MKFRQLFNDDDAVSPVIGVILMVAITVILAAVIATFVLGLGEQVSDTAPESSFEFDYNGTAPGEGDHDDSWENSIVASASEDDQIEVGDAEATLTITHTGGPNIDGSQLGVVGSSVEVGTDELVDYSSFADAGIDQMSAGQSVDIFMLEDDSISVVWTSDDGSTSSTLRTFDGPEA